jgi:nucleoside-diphosphate-sugar epimerase
LTGATGHTGRRLAQRLLEKGFRLRCLVHTPEHRRRLPEGDRVEIVYGSAESEKDLVGALEGLNTVLHLAHIRYAPVLVRAIGARLGSGASPSPPTPASAPAPASESPSAAPAAAGGEIRLVALSSTRLFSRFPSETQDAVRAGEEAILSAPPGVRWTILRSAMIFGGPDDNNLERVAAAAKRWRVFPVFGAGNNLVQPVFVHDLVDAIVACLERPRAAGRCYTIAGDDAMTYREMIRAVARACGAKAPVFLSLPRAPSLWAARLLRRVCPRAAFDPEMIERFGEDKRFDISDARRDLGFSPTPFVEALARKFRR